MTAAVLIGVIALICLTAMGVCVAVTSRRSVSDAFRALDIQRDDSIRQMDSVLDRLMTIKWEDFVAARAAQETDVEGGWEVPGGKPEGETGQKGGVWGHLTDIRGRLGLDNEQTILEEDFDETGAPRK